jgi:hypothetical protein
MNGSLTVKASVMGYLYGEWAVNRLQTVWCVGGKRRNGRGRDGNTDAGQEHPTGALHLLAVQASR